MNLQCINYSGLCNLLTMAIFFIRIYIFFTLLTCLLFFQLYALTRYSAVGNWFQFHSYSILTKAGSYFTSMGSLLLVSQNLLQSGAIDSGESLALQRARE